MDKDMMKLIIENILPLGCILLLVSAFLWSTVLAIVFLVKTTRVKKSFGTEFDITMDRRRK